MPPRPPAGLRSALADRARVITRKVQGDGPKVSGRTPLGGGPGSPGPWFACRLAIPGETPEDRGDRLSRVRVSRHPQLLFNSTAEDGTTVQLRPDDQLEVSSNQLQAEAADAPATTIWQVDGQPLVIRRKKRLLGASVCAVTRMEEPHRRGAARLERPLSSGGTSGSSLGVDS